MRSKSTLGLILAITFISVVIACIPNYSPRFYFYFFFFLGAIYSKSASSLVLNGKNCG
jgi:hypothetical protein